MELFTQGDNTKKIGELESGIRLTKKEKWFSPNSIKKNKFYISLIVYKHHTCITSIVNIL